MTLTIHLFGSHKRAGDGHISSLIDEKKQDSIRLEIFCTLLFGIRKSLLAKLVRENSGIL